MFLLLLFILCMIGFIWKLLVFGVRASWGIMKLLCTVVLFPLFLIGMVVGGLLYLALPLLVVAGVLAFIIL